MNFLTGKEYYWVDALGPAVGEITATQATADKGRVRQTGFVLATDADTRYWKAGRPAAFTDIRVGDKLLAKTHGVGKGKARVFWEVLLDDASRDRFRADQQAVHKGRMEAEGLPGYVDAAEGATLRLTLFSEGSDLAKALKPGQRVRVAPAGVDRKPTADPTAGTVISTAAVGRCHEVTLTVGRSDGYNPSGLARLWAE